MIHFLAKIAVALLWIRAASGLLPRLELRSETGKTPTPGPITILAGGVAIVAVSLLGM